MKNLSIILFIALSYSAQAQKGKLTIQFSFNGIEEGYDYVTRDQIFVDGVLLTTTDEHLESEPFTLTVKVNRGKHSLNIVNWTKYQGTWEETRKDSDYSIDGFFTQDFIFGKKNTLNVLYDLDDPENTPILLFK